MEFEWMSLIWLRLDTIWGVLGAFLVSLGIILETIGSIFKTPGAPNSEPKSSRRQFGLPRSSFEEFGTDFWRRFLGFCYSCTFLNGFLKSCFWILRQLYVFDAYYIGFVDKWMFLKFLGGFPWFPRQKVWHRMARDGTGWHGSRTPLTTFTRSWLARGFQNSMTRSWLAGGFQNSMIWWHPEGIGSGSPGWLEAWWGW